jgi:hypothetical protein
VNVMVTQVVHMGVRRLVGNETKQFAGQTPGRNS